MSTRALLGRLTDIVEYERWRERLAFIQGYLLDLEGYTLMLLAAHGPGVGAIVELGSYLGRSTAFLAAGSQSNGREIVTAVDHFRGSPVQQAGQPFQSEVLLREGSTYPRFLENMTKAGLGNHVKAVVGDTIEVARNWSGPIRLLFIDADHEYESCRRDFEAWSPFVVPLGIVCFHDVGRFPGVTKVYQEVMQSGGYEELATVCSLKVVQRRSVKPDQPSRKT